MKKIITSHKFTQKMFLAIMIILLLNFAVPTRSQAGIGGMLLDPLVDLLGTICDIVTGALQGFLVDGQMNNNKDSDLGFTNWFMIDVNNFKKDLETDNASERKYADWEVSENEEADETFKENELDSGWFGMTGYFIPALRYSPEKIFSGLIPALDINFVKPIDWGNDAMNERSIAHTLHDTIANWYTSLRDLVIVGLMLVLVYVGIRIVISSTASDKAKYKQMLVDWVVALCIVFCLHYIMVLTTTVVNQVSQAINGTAEDKNGNNIVVAVTGDSEDDTKVKFRTDLMGLMRFKMQYSDGGQKLLFLILYIAMVIYTCMFTFYYLKRVLTMAFLTLIAPLIALTYPIDKIRDGKAQAFNMWLKEFTFNALIQPFHLIIYTIFVGTAVDLAAANPLYAIIALAFLTPAEKLLRKFFGFENASTAGSLGALAGVAGGAAFMSKAQHALSAKKGGSGSGKEKKNVRTKQRVEGDTPSLGETLGGSTNGKEALLEHENEKFGTDESDLQAREALERENNTTPADMGYTDEERRQIEREAGYLHGRHGFEWTEDDTRGMGRYLADAAKHGAGFVGGKIANTGAGRFTSKTVKSLSNQLGEAKNYLAGKKAVRKIKNGVNAIRTFKPLVNTARTLGNTAKGIGNVALQTGKSVGTAALKAAPGALVGMAAGIAGDELGDIWKYTTAGAALSSTIGSGALSQAGSFISNAYNSAAHGTDADIIARQEKEYVKSTEWDDVYKHEFKHDDGSALSKSELKAKKKQGAFYDSRNISGEDAIKAVKLEDKIKKELGEGNQQFNAQDYTARIMKIAKPYTADKLRKESEVKNLTKSLTNELKRSGLGQKAAESEAQRAVKYIKQAKGVKD